MKIKSSLPLLDQDVLNAVQHSLTDVDWLCAGPHTKALEQEVAKLTGSEAVLCVSSWTSGAMLVLRWFDVGPRDEVIVNAYMFVPQHWQ